MSDNVKVEPAPDGSESTRTVTLRSICAHLAGILATLNFTGAVLFGTILPAAMFAVAIAVSFPAVKRHTEALLGAELSTPATVVIYLSMTFIGNFIFLIQMAA